MLNTVKVGMVSLGCPKNQCDAELMLAKIARAGFRLVNEPGLADVVIINTCCFIQAAKEEAIEEIMEAIHRKEDGFNKKIIITGCLSERYGARVAEEFPEADGVLSLAGNTDIVEAINGVLLNMRPVSGEFGNAKGHNMEGERLLSTLPHYAYLRIADGCDNHCSYCAIPTFRGGFRSREKENIVREARGLAENGVKEIILVAQDVTNYGSDLYGKPALPELLRELSAVEGVKWLRLLYCYPERVTDELIEVIKTEEKIVKYIDLPIQHCNRDILKAMNRPGDERSLWDLVAKLRGAVPGIVIRATLLVGFPGETEEQFTELAEFVNGVKFEHLGCFAYSEEENTPAAGFPDQVEESERRHRAEVIAEQQEVRLAAYLEELKGREYETVVEGFDRYFEMYFGRNYMYAPEIDGMLYFSAKKGKPILGRFVTVKITDVVDNNLIGEITGYL
ncbi:MAG: 30S ribosomal protein S12 methylthiotransferase RimO [Oscillospiraceae bacterium]|jgi:ribosomal protein S12 methylthiotransferase|nr:30S ribosomal protein S12 methylthiotransferase RimO [Oscillospiraceae bacterium]